MLAAHWALVSLTKACAVASNVRLFIYACFWRLRAFAVPIRVASVRWHVSWSHCASCVCLCWWSHVVGVAALSRNDFGLKHLPCSGRVIPGRLRLCEPWMEDPNRMIGEDPGRDPCAGCCCVAVVSFAISGRSRVALWSACLLWVLARCKWWCGQLAVRKIA